MDWRAPVAEPFYRATGRAPMGLARRRHFATKGRTLLGIEDELFGDALRLDGDGADGDGDGNGRHPRSRAAARCSRAIESARTGRLTDIVATIQGEQDEIIRSELARRARRPGRPRHRQDRRGPAPRRLPPLHATGSRSKARACSSSAPTGCSSATSSRCCRRSARPASSSSCSPTC